MTDATTKPRTPSFLSSSLRVFELSLGEMLWSRRTIFMALVLSAPVILALVSRIVQSMGVAPLRVNGARVGGAGIFGMMIWVLYIRFTIPMLGVFYGTSLIADEVDDKTLTYLFTRPVQRGAVLVGKYLAYLVCTSLVVLPSVMVVYFMLVRFPEIPGTFFQLLTDLGWVDVVEFPTLDAARGLEMWLPLWVRLMGALGTAEFNVRLVR